MKSAIENYLNQLENLLKKRIRADERTQIVEEVRSHLVLSAREHADKGNSQDVAERLAVHSFGHVKVVAARLVRQQTGVDRASVWKLAALPVAVFVFASFLPEWGFKWGGVAHFQAMMLLSMALKLGTFSYCVIRSRRWLAFPLALALLGVNFYSAYSVSTKFAFEQDSSRAYSIGNPGGIQNQFVENEEMLRRAQSATFAALHHEPVMESLVPHIISYKTYEWSWGRPVVNGEHQEAGLERADAEVIAAKWRALGPSEVSLLEARKRNLEQAAGDAANPRRAAWRMFVSNLPGSATTIAFLFLTNGFLLLMASFSDRFLSRRSLKSSS